MLKDNIVTKANDLNLRAYKLNRIEQLLVLSVASMIQPNDEDFKTYKIYIRDFMDLLSIQDQSKYVELPKITKGLMSKVIEIKREHSLLQVCWFSSVEHKLGDGIIEVEFSPKLKPYLLNLKDNFVSYALNEVSKLSSKYSIRIYELLKQYQFRKTIEFEINEFRELIGLDDTMYPRYSNMKPKILLSSQKELRSKSDIFFKFEEIKTGRKVTSLKFYIYQNNVKSVDNVKMSEEVSATVSEDNEQEKEDLEKIIYMMKAENIKELDAIKIYKAANGDINKIQEKYNLSKSMPGIKNIVGWMIKAIQEDYHAIKGKGKIDNFNNFEQRQYDFEDLERKLLGWDNEE